MKRLGIFLLPLGWDATSIPRLPPAINSPVPIVHLGEERHYESSVLPKNTTQCPWPGHEPALLNLELCARHVQVQTFQLKLSFYYMYVLPNFNLL